MEDIHAFIAQAEKDRFALIIDEDAEDYANAHLREIFSQYPCTGILVRQTHDGVSYHATKANANAILREGLRPSWDEGATFGPGVIYTFPNLSCYTRLTASHNVFEVRYGPGTLRAIATVEKSDREQGEVCVFPSCVKSISFIGTGEKVIAAMGTIPAK